MAKTVKFADPKTTLMHVSGFGKINAQKLTFEVYEHLVKLNPKHASMFIVTDDAEEKGKQSKPDKA